MRKKIFMVTYGGGHANIVKCVYEAMDNAQKSETQILALTTADSVLAKAKIPHKTVNDYMELFPYRKEATEIGKVFLKNGSSPEIKEEDTIAYYGLSYYELLKECGECEARRLFKEKGRAAFLPVNTLKKILKYENPEVVVVNNTPRMEKAAAMAANKLNIPVVRINDMPKMTEAIQYKATVCVMNDWAREDIKDNKLADSDQVKVTGQPVFEKNLIFDEEKKKRYFNSIHSKFEKCIIYLGQAEPYCINAAVPTVKQLRELADKYSSYCFIVRPHPNSNGSYGCENTENFFITKDGELKYLLSECDLAITHYSTSGMEAALLDKPVITVFSDDYTKETSLFENWGIAVSVKNISDIEKTMLLLLDKKSKMYTELNGKRALFKNKENAAQNIIKTIFETMNNGR